MIKNTDSLTAVQGLINFLAPVFGFAGGFTFNPVMIKPYTNLEKIYQQLDFTKKHLTNGAKLSDKDFKDIVDKVNGYEVFTLTATAATPIGQTTATLNGSSNIKDTAKILESGFVRATTINPTTANTKIIKGGAGPFTQAITGLTASTTYHYRVYVITDLGTFYSNDISFTTTA